jgi:hypothetical protein
MKRIAGVAIAASLAVLAMLGATAIAQTNGQDGAQPPATNWTPPRTPWGDPDLRGTWPLDAVGRTPMQRPEALGDKAMLTDEEYRAALESAEKSAQGYDREDKANRIGSGHWFEWGKPLRQTSLIMEPANGRIPPLTAEGERRSKAMKSSWSQATFEDISDFNSLDRCITRGLPASMIPFPYNNGVQIYQSPGYVVIRLELVHETRIIPLDGRPPLPGSMSKWLGDSRGHWKGNTLVIETRNFTGATPMNIVGPGNKPIPTSTSLRIVEHLTPTGPDTLYYEAWIEDPVVLTAPFKMAFPWSRNDKYELFEYACHEGNTVVPNYIRSTSPRFNKNPGKPSDARQWIRDTVDF